MIAGVRPSCATCQFFNRFTTADMEDSVTPLAATGQPADADSDALLEFGKCLRNPPQFFYDTLNGEWPVIHESKLCGEYRVTNSNPYV